MKDIFEVPRGNRNAASAAWQRVLSFVLALVLPVLITMTVLGSTPARASSDDAWAAFARNVAKACKTGTGSTFVKPEVIVDPFGSETYGLAIVTGKLKAGGKAGTMLCVYDKKTGKAEVGSELGEEVVRVSKGKGKM